MIHYSFVPTTTRRGGCRSTFLIGLLVTVFGCCAMFFAASRYYHAANFEYVSRVTGIVLPVGSPQLDSNDNLQNMVVVYTQLQRQEIEPLIQKYRFQPANQPQTGYDRTPWFLQGAMRELGFMHNSLPAEAQLYIRSECDWNAAIDITTGQLWIAVNYPDWGGVGPTCP